jgi:hypothetical protein
MRWLLLSLSVLLMSLSVGCENNRAAGGWWRYSLSGSSPFWHELHAYDDDPTQDQTMIAALTLFADEKRAVHHLLENDGRGKTIRGTIPVGFRRTPAEVSEAMALLSGLQPGGPYPAPEKLVILRWYQDGKWVMARFDRSALPDAVQSLATIISGRPVGDIEP